MWGKRGKERSERHVQRMERIVVRNYFRGARLVGCFQRGMNVLEHFGPIKETACLFKRDIQFARLFEKFLKKRKRKRKRERKNIAFRASSKCIWYREWGGWRLGSDCMEEVDYDSRRIKSFQPSYFL